MSQALTELHGKRAGIDHDGYLGSNKGSVSGFGGRQFYAPSPHKAVLLDDFLDDTLDLDRWQIVEGSDPQAVAARLAGAVNGVARLTSGDAGTGEAADAVAITGPLEWKAEQGGLVLEARIKVDVITAVYIFVGFTDQDGGTIELPVELAGTTYTTNATDAVGFMFDTDATLDTWKATSVANDSDGNQEDLSVSSVALAPVAAQYETLRLELNAVGDAKFYRNGVQVGLLHAVAVTPTVALCPTIVWANLSGTTSRLLDIDYIHVAGNRGLDGTAV